MTKMAYYLLREKRVFINCFCMFPLIANGRDMKSSILTFNSADSAGFCRDLMVS